MDLRPDQQRSSDRIAGLINPMAAQFTPAGPRRYIYRASGKGPPIPVTAAERDRYVRSYPRMFVLFCVIYMLAVIDGSIVISHFYPGGNETGGFVMLAILIVAVAVVLISWIRYYLHGPAREFAGRIVGDPITPRRGA